jgi:hypothetical protein
MKALRSVVAVAVLLAVGGCAGGQRDAAERPLPDRPSPTASPSGDDVVAVRVVVSGGITGRRLVVALPGDRALRWMTTTRQERLLDLAGRVASTREDAAASAPACCDVRTVELRLHYADGTRTRVAVPETELPGPLTRLVSLASDTR